MKTASPAATVSVVMPTYNRRGLVGEAIDSVLAQTFRSWELVIVDDGSTDGTGKRIEPYLADARIRYFRQENRGQAAARNRALDHCTGRYIAFLDSDNRWLPGKLEAQLRCLDADETIGLVYGDNVLIDAGGARLADEPQVVRHSGYVLDRLIMGNFVTFNTVVVRSAAMEGLRFDEAMRGGEDYDLLLRLAGRVRFERLDAVLCEYRIEGDRVSDGALEVLTANERSLRQVFSTHEVARHRQRQALGRIRGRMAMAERRSGSAGRALRLAAESCCLRPLQPGGWRILAKVLLNRVDP